MGHRIIVGKRCSVVFVLRFDDPNQSEWFKCKSTKITKSEFQRTSISKQDQDKKRVEFWLQKRYPVWFKIRFFGYFSWQQKNLTLFKGVMYLQYAHHFLQFLKWVGIIE